jgi:cell shape-determining protein MreD
MIKILALILFAAILLWFKFIFKSFYAPLGMGPDFLLLLVIYAGFQVQRPYQDFSLLLLACISALCTGAPFSLAFCSLFLVGFFASKLQKRLQLSGISLQVLLTFFLAFLYHGAWCFYLIYQGGDFFSALEKLFAVLFLTCLLAPFAYKVFHRFHPLLFPAMTGEVE